MALSKKHYEEVAAIIAYRLSRAQSPDEVSGIEGVAMDLVHMFANDNSQFDRDRFREACGL